MDDMTRTCVPTCSCFRAWALCRLTWAPPPGITWPSSRTRPATPGPGGPAADTTWCSPASTPTRSMRWGSGPWTTTAGVSSASPSSSPHRVSRPCVKWWDVYFKSALFLGRDKQELLSSSLLKSKSPNIYTLSKLLIILVPALTFF